VHNNGGAVVFSYSQDDPAHILTSINFTNPNLEKRGGPADIVERSYISRTSDGEGYKGRQDRGWKVVMEIIIRLANPTSLGTQLTHWVQWLATLL
jgi:hypothetical protein